VSNTTTKIWLLLVATGTLLCAGCATKTAAQRDQRINRTLQGFIIQAQHTEEQISGKARKDWGPTETAAYNALVLRALHDWSRYDAERAGQQRAALAAIGSGLQSAGEQIRTSAQQPVGGGSSGYGSGVILGPNGTAERQHISKTQVAA
jgi:hypothetical protein